MRRFVFALLLLAPALWLSQPARAQDPLEMEKIPDLVKLNEKDVQGFIDVTGKLRKLREDELSAGTKPEALEKPAADVNEKALAVLAGHGFTRERFQQVGYSIGVALAADEIKKTPEELKAARAKQQQMMEGMKDKVSPEQYAQMQKQLAVSDRMLGDLQKLPPGNLELVRKHAAEIKSAVGAP